MTGKSVYKVQIMRTDIGQIKSEREMYQVSEKLIHAVISGKLLHLPGPQFAYIPDRRNLRTPAVGRGFLESRQGREKEPFLLQWTAREAEPPRCSRRFTTKSTNHLSSWLVR